MSDSRSASTLHWGVVAGFFAGAAGTAYLVLSRISDGDIDALAWASGLAVAAGAATGWLYYRVPRVRALATTLAQPALGTGAFIVLTLVAMSVSASVLGVMVVAGLLATGSFLGIQRSVH